jgi:hypothetical protein
MTQVELHHQKAALLLLLLQVVWGLVLQSQPCLHFLLHGVKLQTLLSPLLHLGMLHMLHVLHFLHPHLWYPETPCMLQQHLARTEALRMLLLHAGILQVMAGLWG